MQSLPSLQELEVSEEESKLSDVLQLCHWSFQNQAQSSSNYFRIFLFTANDDPSKGNDEERRKIKDYVELLEDNNIQIELFPLVFEKNLFCFDNFYKGVLKFSEEDLNSGMMDGAERIEQLQYRLKKKEVIQRISLKSNLQLSSAHKIGIKAFSIYRKLAPQTSIPLDSNSLQTLK